MKTNKLAAFNLEQCQQRIQLYLQAWLNKFRTPDRLLSAMRYSVLNGGKRLRPLLTYATGLGLGAKLEDLDPAAAVVELIHCYSLIHDDLPAMDNDDLRRGQPTCHKAFDEATAILAGDALQTLAFEILAEHEQPWNLSSRVLSVKTLAQASGIAGMAGGQMLDIEAENKRISLPELETLHSLKTGALIRASVRLGALAAGCQDAQCLENLDQFARLIGLAFQVQDDLLDVESSTEVLGKRAGADEALNKMTYPSLLGVEVAKTHLQDLYHQASVVLAGISCQTLYLQEVWNLLKNRQS